METVLVPTPWRDGCILMEPVWWYFKSRKTSSGTYLLWPANLHFRNRTSILLSVDPFQEKSSPFSLRHNSPSLYPQFLTRFTEWLLCVEVKSITLCFWAYAHGCSLFQMWRSQWTGAGKSIPQYQVLTNEKEGLWDTSFRIPTSSPRWYWLHRVWGHYHLMNGFHYLPEAFKCKIQIVLVVIMVFFLRQQSDSVVDILTPILWLSSSKLSVKDPWIEEPNQMNKYSPAAILNARWTYQYSQLS